MVFLPRSEQQAQNTFVAGYYYTIIPSNMHCTKQKPRQLAHPRKAPQPRMHCTKGTNTPQPRMPHTTTVQPHGERNHTFGRRRSACRSRSHLRRWSPRHNSHTREESLALGARANICEHTVQPTTGTLKGPPLPRVKTDNMLSPGRADGDEANHVDATSEAHCKSKPFPRP